MPSLRPVGRKRSPRHRNTAAALFACAGLGLPGAAFAQETVGAETAEDEVLQLDTLVITASGFEQNIRDAPASVTVIDREQLDRVTRPDLTEVIRTVPGVNVGFGSDGTRGISIRGLSSAYTLILIDGKRVNASATTLRHYNGDLDWVPMSAIERIEVVRGPMSTLYGSDALGGVVNIITRKATDRWTGTLTGTYFLPDDDATGDTAQVNAYVAGPLTRDLLSFAGWGNWSKSEPGDGAAANGIEVPDGLDNYDFNGRFTLTPSPDHTFEVEGGFGRESYDPYLADGEVDTAKTSIERVTASVRHIGAWDFGTSTVTGYLEDARNHNGVTGLDMESGTYTLDARLVTPVEMFFPQMVTSGGELRYEELDDPVNLGQENSVTGTSGAPFNSALTAALYVEDEVTLRPDLRLTGGIRYDYHEEFGSHFSPRLYLNYDILESLTFKTGWAQAFKAPNLRQLDPNWVTTSRGRGCGAVGGPCEMVGNPDLKPETSNSYEAGLYFDNGRIQSTFAYFLNDIDNKITSARVATLVTPDGTNYVQQINVDRARSQGLEGGFNVQLLDSLTWNNSFTYLIESKNLETGMPLSADPDLALHTELVWQAMEGLSFTGSLDYYGEQVDYVQEPETLIAQNVDPYWIASISSKYAVNERMSVKAGVNNIFNSQPKSESNFREDGRTYFLSLTGTF